MYIGVPASVGAGGGRSRHGDAEVGDADAAVLVDQDVGRLQVAMEHALGVRGGSPAQSCRAISTTRPGASRPACRSSAARSSPSTSSIEKNTSSSASPTSNTRTTAGCVIWRARRTSLQEALAPGLAGGPNQLQGDRRLEHQVVGPPHVAHAAAAEARDHPVPHAEDEPRRERALVGGLGLRRRAGAGSAGGVDLVKAQQRLDFLPQGGVVAAGICQKRLASAPLALERGDEEILGPLWSDDMVGATSSTQRGS